MRMILLISLMFLSSCVSFEEIKLRKSQQEIAECLSLGFKENTSEFRNCRLQLRNIEAQKMLGFITLQKGK